MAGQSASMTFREWIITPAQLEQEMKQVTLVDVREPEENEISQIEGGKLIPLGEIILRATSELDPEENIVLYCAHGIRSLHALIGLQKLGFKKIRSLEGGIVAWLEWLDHRNSTH
jgi:rhodanese-related sulfurtransferase